ncbi:hypothetical protein [Agrobacterium larrymoorei]|uniref:Uncharacterized protein n=1 Tax=Agrobacterium larrymoorei TaxID=160699 RepID=A0A4D7E101_9HYPH|nr:hypothetical protein [Agrobacterium larrymoorei]QCJ00003.1 hypothetical protein CFBP5473_18850 [Agrobacterium larrymoorei]QYA09555.1 hypothetical protein J5285_19490 [Agrobacterium larrymoorei]WHA43030.1 hypothetical protein CFBP5477_017380 [Agrobacterium larrymoorei]
MLSDIAAWFITLFVVDPLQAQVREHLDRANASTQIIQQSQQCIASQAPQLLKRAGEQPGWAIATAAGFSLGWTSPVQLLDTSDPNCAAIAGLLRNDEGAEAES